MGSPLPAYASLTTPWTDELLAVAGDERIPRTIASKDLSGWIPATRKLTVAPNTSRTVTLERLAQPGSGNYLMAQIPMDNTPDQFYTVEARRRVSYDKYLPGDAVVLHQVDPDRSPCVGCGEGSVRLRS